MDGQHYKQLVRKGIYSRCCSFVARLLLDLGSPTLPQSNNNVQEISTNDSHFSDHPFRLALRGGYWDICELFIDWKNDIITENEAAKNDMSFLHYTVASDAVEVVDRLLVQTLPAKTATQTAALLIDKYNAEISITTMNEACQNGSVDLVRFLMSRASDKVLTPTRNQKKTVTMMKVKNQKYFRLLAAWKTNYLHGNATFIIASVHQNQLVNSTDCRQSEHYLTMKRKGSIQNMPQMLCSMLMRMAIKR